MPRSRLITVLALAALFVLGIGWMLLDPGVGLPAAPLPSTAAHAAGDASTATAGDGGGSTTAADADAREQRIAVDAAADTAPRAGGAEPALVGQVCDDAGTPLADAEVLATPQFEWTPDFDQMRWREAQQELLQLRVQCTTDADGRFRLQPRGSSNNVDVRVLARGFAVLQQNPSRPTDADVDLGTLTLKRGGVVAGRVVGADGRGVAGATVDRRDAREGFEGMHFFSFDGAGMRPGEETVTDDDGRFELGSVAAGKFSLRARHPEHPDAQRPGLELQPGQVLNDVLVTLDNGASIGGRLRDLPREHPPVRVLASPRRQASGEQQENPFGGYAGGGERIADVAADGSFVLHGLHLGGGYRVWAAESTSTGVTACCKEVEVPAGARGVELRYDAGVTVTCRVLDARTARPVEPLSVRATLRGGGNGMFWGDQRAKFESHPDGVVRIRNLRPQPKQLLNLDLDAIGYEHYDRDRIALPTTGSMDLGDVRLEPMPAVEIVVAGADGAPLAEAQVNLRLHREAREAPPEMFPGQQAGGPRSGRTDAEGRCRLSSLPGKQVVIAIQHKQHARFTSEPIELPEKEDYHFQARLLRGGVLKVDVQNADGTPAAKIHVEHKDPDQRHDGRACDAQGHLVFEHQVPGTHRLRVYARDDPGDPARRQQPRRERDETGWTEIEVADGGRCKLTLLRSPTATVSGVVRQDNEPLANARVSFVDGTGAPGDARPDPMEYYNTRSTRTDAAGRFELKEVAPGEHRLRVTHGERAMAATVPASLRVGDNRRDIDLDVTVVRGVVRDPDGKPVQGASVSLRLPAADGKGSGLPDEMRGQGGSSRSDAEGRFELRGVQGGVSLQVRASGKGFGPGTSTPFEVAAGKSCDGIEVRLQAAGSIRVLRTDPSGFAYTRAVCESGPSKGQNAGWEALSDKGALLEGLLPGRWRVTLHNGDQELEPRTVEVVAGQTVEVRF